MLAARPVAVASCGGLDEAGLGVKDGEGGVGGRPGDGVDAGSVSAAQFGRLGDGVVGAVQRHGADGQCMVDDPINGRLDQPRREAGGPHPAQGLGANVPDVPVRAPGLYLTQCRRGGARDPGVVDVDDAGALRLRHSGQHPRQPVLAEHVDSLGVPLGELLGAAARGLLRLARLQGGLLGQVAGLGLARWPGVGGVEAGGELALAGLDRQAPARPALREALIHPGDLTRRPLAQVAVRPVGEHQPRPVGQVLLQAGVVGLRRAHRGRVQDPPVDRQPPPVQGLDLVGHRQVGVQVRVAGAGVAVDERSRDRTAHVDLAYPVAAGAGEQRVAFEVGQGVGHRLVVGGLDLVPDRGRGDRPQRGHALGGGERQVVAGHRTRARAGVLGDRGADLTGVGRVPAVLGPEQAAGHLGADAGPVVDVDRVVTGQAGGHVVLLEPARHLTTEQRHILGGGVHLERRAQAHRRPPLRLGGVRAQRFEPFGGQRVVAGSEQQPHLLGGHRVAGVEPVQAGQPGTHPRPGSLTLGGVVVGQPGVALTSGVLPRHLPGQVVIARSGGELVQAHRHTC